MDKFKKGPKKQLRIYTKLKFAKTFLNSVLASMESDASSCTKKRPMKDKNNTTEKECPKSTKIPNSFSWTKSNSSKDLDD